MMFPGQGGFGNATAGGPQPNVPIVQFKAGRCTLTPKADKFTVTPETQKGLITMIKGEDQLIRFQWKDRQTNNMIDDLVLMPEDAEFKKVNTGKPEDRVYILQYKGTASNRRFMYWMQDLKTEKDEENMKLINDSINGILPTPTSAGGPGTGNAQNDALMQMLQGYGQRPPSSSAGGSSTNNNTSTPGQGGALQLDQLQSILGSFNIPGSDTTPTTAPAPGTTPATATATATAQPGTTPALTTEDFQRAMMGMQQQPRPVITPLTEVVNADEILRSGILNDPAVQEQLIPLLAEGQQNREQLDEIMRSPQLRGALGSLSGALQTENFNSILSNFGLDPSQGQSELVQGNGIGAFLQALLALQRTENSSNDEKTNDDNKET